MLLAPRSVLACELMNLITRSCLSTVSCILTPAFLFDARYYSRLLLFHYSVIPVLIDFYGLDDLNDFYDF